MFCSKCGKTVPNQAQFCPNCGNPIQNVSVKPKPSQNISAEPNPDISDKWAWMLACVPIVGTIIEVVLIQLILRHEYSSESEEVIFGNIINLALVIPLVLQDVKEIKKKVKGAYWFWVGILIPPAYLFMRAAKINKQFGYAILWCVSLIISVLLFEV